jgi:hypothetical protein
VRGTLHPATAAPQKGLFELPELEHGPGALLQIAAIQSAASDRPVTLAGAWLRLLAGAGIALLFSLMAFRDESALALGERGVSPSSVILVQLARSVAFGLAGPALIGGAFSAVAFIFADLGCRWRPILGTMLGSSASDRSARAALWSCRTGALHRRAARDVGAQRFANSEGRAGGLDLAGGPRRITTS